MKELMLVRRWKKRNTIDFYWGVVKVSVGSIQYGVIETFWAILSLYAKLI